MCFSRNGDTHTVNGTVGKRRRVGNKCVRSVFSCVISMFQLTCSVRLSVFDIDLHDLHDLHDLCLNTPKSHLRGLR